MSERLSSGCGPRSLFVAAKTLSLPVTESAIFDLFPFPENDTSFAELQNVARHLGMEAEGRRSKVKELRSQKWIGILHIDGTHFVTLTGCDGSAFLITETGYASGLREERWSENDLAARWDGNILILRRRNPKTAK